MFIWVCQKHSKPVSPVLVVSLGALISAWLRCPTELACNSVFPLTQCYLSTCNFSALLLLPMLPLSQLVSINVIESRQEERNHLFYSEILKQNYALICKY